MTFLHWLLGLGSVALFVWIFYIYPQKPWTKQERINADEQSILGIIAGGLGGQLRHMIIAQQALDRFEKQYGRKATPDDIDTVISLVSLLRDP
jgi:hypothetical protein